MTVNAIYAIEEFSTFIGFIWTGLKDLEFFGFGFSYASLLKYLFLFGVAYSGILAYIHFTTPGQLDGFSHTLKLVRRNSSKSEKTNNVNK